MWRKLLSRPEALLVLSFATLIVVGTGLLALPAAQAGDPIPLLDLWFTATSAVCVTGLVTVDPPTVYSRFGLTVIMVLFQLGGLGIMSFGVLAAQLFRKRMTFVSQAAVQSAYFESQAAGNLGRALRYILLLTLAFEAGGALLLYRELQAREAGGLFEATFLSISAFCNAGFSVYPDSLMRFADAPVFLGTVIVLIVVGGLGYSVLIEVTSRTTRAVRRRPQSTVRWTLQTRVVLGVSAGLLFGGAAALFLLRMPGSETGYGRQALDALFQSVTARTAGFNTIDIAGLPMAALLLLMALMFIGGSPGSCAGGVKTTTAAVWAARLWARLTGRDDVVLGQRVIPNDIVRRATLLLSVAGAWNIIGLVILSISEGQQPGANFEFLVFEQFSAFGTVGLSAGVTPTLSAAGKGWIILTMFVGRLGALTVALAVLRPPRTLYHYPRERLMLG